MKKVFAVFVLVIFCTALFASGIAEQSQRIPIKVLILPKFEIGELHGDYPGEAQLCYEHYLMGSDSYDLPCAGSGSKVYVKDGVAMENNFKVGSAIIDAILDNAL